MQGPTTVLYQLLQQVPWERFAQLAAEPAYARRVRGFNAESHLVALLYAQLSGAASLGEIELGMASQTARLAPLGVTPARRSTLADANRDRPSTLFIALLLWMVSHLNRAQRRGLAETTYLIDASFLALPARYARWARFSATTCGAKMHVIYDEGEGRPIYAAISAANVNDITAAQAMPLRAGATYVFDLGYYDYGWWATLDAAQCRIVTRLKSNTPLRVIATRPVPAGGAILADRIGFLPARQAQRRRNPMADAVREVVVRLEHGVVLRILSNDLDASALEIAALYKRRWQIELFFRWLKQVLRIRHFYGGSANAVCIQVATALIAYLLLRSVHACQAVSLSLLTLARLVRLNLMLACPIEVLLRPIVRGRRRREVIQR